MSKEFSHNVIPKSQTVECGWHTEWPNSKMGTKFVLLLLLYDLKKCFK